MKIQFISDTHGYHKNVVVDTSCDMIIHSGDETNHPSPHRNNWEFLSFINWFGKLSIKHKVLVPGNHSAFIYHHEPQARMMCQERGIHLLIHESIDIDGISIFGSPYTPPFGNWFYMRDEDRLDEIYSHFDYHDIVATHGPAYGILDKGFDGEPLGSTSTLKFINRIKPKIHTFGHIHDDIVSNGYYTDVQSKNNGAVLIDDILRINASFVDNYYTNFNIVPIVFSI